MVEELKRKKNSESGSKKSENEDHNAKHRASSPAATAPKPNNSTAGDDLRKADQDNKHWLDHGAFWAAVAAAVFAAGTVGVGLYQASISEQTKNLQFRPTIAFTGVTLKRAGNLPDIGEPLWQFMPHIQNVGSMPTQGMFCKFGADLKIGLDGIVAPAAARDVWGKLTDEKHIQSLGPSIPSEGFGVTLPGANINDIAKGTTVIGFFGRIEYNQTRITEFCVTAAIPSLDYNRTSLTEVEVLPIPCPKHNCTDEDCAAQYGKSPLPKAK